MNKAKQTSDGPRGWWPEDQECLKYLNLQHEDKSFAKTAPDGFPYNSCFILSGYQAN
jgi:hypothetical protein